MSTLGMLAFTALGFFLLLKHLDPTPTISLDTDRLYRPGAKRLVNRYLSHTGLSSGIKEMATTTDDYYITADAPMNITSLTTHYTDGTGGLLIEYGEITVLTNGIDIRHYLNNEPIRAAKRENTVFSRLAEVENDPCLATFGPYTDIFDGCRRLRRCREQREECSQDQALSGHRSRQTHISGLCRVSIPSCPKNPRFFVQNYEDIELS